MTPPRVAVPILNIWHMLRYAWGIKLPEDVSGVDNGDPLRAENLLAHLLIALLRKLTRRGLVMAYRDHIEAMTVPRGRFLISETVHCGAAIHRQAVCERDEMMTDVLPNRAIKSAVTTLLRAVDLDSLLVLQLRALLLHFADIEPAQFGDARKAFRTARDGLYRRTLLLCIWIEEARFVNSDRGDNDFGSVTMSPKKLGRLFELFLKKFFAKLQQRLHRSERVKVSKKKLSWPQTHVNLPGLETDICLEGPALRMVIEVKCSEGVVATRFGAQKVPSGHLYQLYSYLHNLAASSGGIGTVGAPPWQGALIYGRTQASIADFDAGLAEFKISVRSIDLSLPWAQVEAQAYSVLDSLIAAAGNRASPED